MVNSGGEGVGGASFNAAWSPRNENIPDNHKIKIELTNLEKIDEELNEWHRVVNEAKESLRKTEKSGIN